MSLKLSITIITTLLITISSASSSLALQAPIGSLDTYDGTTIAGWTYDPDYSGPISAHIYVDGVFVHSLIADQFRQDVYDVHGRNAAFHWNHPPFGWGEHSVVVHAIGVNSNGTPNGNNPAIGSGIFNVGCMGLIGFEHEWCANNGGYWINRQAATKLLMNNNVKVGINNSYGGTITQLYSDNRSVNLIEEHGGSAVQLSLYAYDISQGTSARWFRKGPCQPGVATTAYLTNTACESVNGSGNCVERYAGLGSHVANCTTVSACNANFTDVGWPFNPIQAQGENCSWEVASNNVSYQGSYGTNGWKITHNSLANYSKSNIFDNLVVDQTATVHDAYVKVVYDITYTGTLSLSEHAQELPAFFTNPGIDYYYYFYEGQQPYTNYQSQVTESVLIPSNNHPYVAMPNWTAWPYDNPSDRVGTATERWWGVCDQTRTKCVTLATFNPLIQRGTVKKSPNGGAYITPKGYYSPSSIPNQSFTLYVFPYKWDKVINNKSIRQRIFELNPSHPTLTPTPTRTPTPQPSPTPTVIYSQIIQVFNKTNSSPVDINGDNVVNIFDLNLWVDDN